MRIVLMAPIIYVNETDNPPHMGLCSLKSVLKAQNHSVEIVNLNPAARDAFEISGFRREGILSTDFYQETVREILRLEPELVGFSTIGASYPTILVLVQRLKAEKPDLPVIFGGIQASLCARETLHYFPEVDYIIAGEAELTLPMFIQHFETRAPFPPDSGIYYRGSDGEICYTGDAPLIQNLDTLPAIYAELDLSPLAEISIDVGRGCPFQCYYCCTNNYWRRTYRLRSADSIVDEIEHYYRTFGKKLFSFNHDLLTCNRTRFQELLHTLKARNIPVRWKGSSRLDTIDEELLEEMAECGCYAIYFGIETGSPRMQKVIRKNLDLTRVIPLLEKCRQLKIDCTASFICGMPEETLDDLLQTTELVYECICRYISSQIHLLAPFQGTELYRRYQDQLKYDGKYSNVGGFVINNDLEESLIQRYPELFCNFYYIDNPHIPRASLRNMEQFSRFLGYFWRTIGVLRYTHGLPFREIVLHFMEQFIATAELADFMRSVVNSVAEPSVILTKVFNFELILFATRSTSDSVEQDSTPQVVRPEAYFCKQRGSKLYPLSFNPTEVEEAIRQHLPADHVLVNQELTALVSAPQPGLMPKFSAVPANSSVISIYNDATGKLRIQDVIDEATEALRGTYTPEEVEESVNNIFKQMIYQRLVTLTENT